MRATNGGTIPASVLKYAPQSLAYFAAMGTQLSTPRKSVIDKFIKGIITDTVFAELEYGFIHRLPVEQQSLVNFCTGNAVLTKVGTPTFTANVGWTSVGANASRLDTPTNYSTFSKFTQNSATFGTWLTTAPSGNIVSMGTSDDRNLLIANYAGAHHQGRVNQTSATALNLGGGGTGLHMFDRDGSSSVKLYKDGSQTGATQTNASVARTATPFSILNANGLAPATGNVHALSFIGGSMSAAQHLALYNRVNTLLTDLAAIP